MATAVFKQSGLLRIDAGQQIECDRCKGIHRPDRYPIPVVGRRNIQINRSDGRRRYVTDQCFKSVGNAAKGGICHTWRSIGEKDVQQA